MKIRRIFVPVLLALIICTSFFMTPVNAATATQDGINIDLATDKTEYHSGDAIDVNVVVKNTNAYPVRNVKIQNLPSEQYELLGTANSNMEIETLHPGETVTMQLSFNTVKSGKSIGSYMIVGVCVLGIVVLVTFIIVFLIKHKKSSKVIAGIMCFVMMGTVVSALPFNVFAKEGTEHSVETTAQVVVDGNTVEIKTVVAYAILDEDLVNTYIVSFQSNGGSDVSAMEVEEGHCIVAPAEPIRDGYIFAGWYTNEECSEKFLFDSTPVVKDMVLYADWIGGDVDTLLAQYVAYQLDIIFQPGDNINHVTQDVQLPTAVEGVDDVVVQWTSSSGTITSDGKVTRPDAVAEKVTLTLDVLKNNAHFQLVYVLNVIPVNNRDKATIPNSSVVDIENMNANGTVEVSYNSDKSQVISIEGKYSDIVVENVNDALDVIQSVHTIVGVRDPYSELKIATSNTDEYGAEYTFNQVFNGYEVYGRRITVSADEKGITDSLNSGVLLTEKLEMVDTTVTVSKSEAERIATGYFGGDCSADSEQTTFAYYTLKEYEVSPAFTYAVFVSGTNNSGAYVEGHVFVNAKDGSVVYVDSKIARASADTGSGKNEFGDKVTFPVAFTWTDWYFFYMQDLKRDIQMYNQVFYTDFRIGSEFNWWTDETAISAYTNVIKTYDWYKNNLNRDSLDGNGFDIKVVVHNAQYSDNAFWSGSKQTLNFCDNSFGSSMNTTTAAALDVVAHEYTHGVVDFVTGGLPYENATGAINEGYADIFGCLVEGNWQIGEDWLTLRDASNPTAHEAPDRLSSEFYVDYTVDSSDNGGVHTNSSLIYYPAYLMHRNGMSTTTLAKLWYKSLHMGYDGTSDFHTVRRNVLKAANKMKLGEDEITIIKKAFDAVEIFGARGTIEGIVTDVSGIALQDATVEIIRNDSVVQTITTNEVGAFTATLDEDAYVVKITMDGYVQYVSNVEVVESEVTTIQAALVQEGNGTVTGTVVSATSAMTIENVKLNVRTGLNVKMGNILTSSATNSNGGFTFELGAGYYTIEMICDGYTTGYINVLVSAGNNTIANGSLSPIMTSSTYRVVLTWGALPDDLDSHLVGELEDGSSFHIYYLDKNAYNNDGEQIANLDVDDTTSYGPETTTFQVETDGNYSFYVHRYSYGSLPDSQATVEVYNGQSLIAKYSIDTSASDNCLYWDVFKIENGIFQTVNVMR